MGDWVLSEDKEVTENNQVSNDESGIRMAEQISTAAGLRSSYFFLVTFPISSGLEQISKMLVICCNII